MKKWIVLAIIYGMFILIGFYYKERVMDWIHESSPSQIPFMFLISTFLSIFPIIPFTLFAGVMGVKYGVILGTVINWFGNVSAASIFFLLSRNGFQETFRKKVKQYKGVAKFNKMIEQNTFIAVLLARLMTIVPPIVVNIYSGLSRMSFKTYFIATGLGTIPSMFFFAFSGRQLFQSFGLFLFGIGIYVLFIVFIIIVYRKWQRRKDWVIE